MMFISVDTTQNVSTPFNKRDDVLRNNIALPSFASEKVLICCLQKFKQPHCMSPRGNSQRTTPRHVVT